MDDLLTHANDSADACLTNVTLTAQSPPSSLGVNRPKGTSHMHNFNLGVPEMVVETTIPTIRD